MTTTYHTYATPTMEDAWEKAIALTLDYLDTNEWDDVPTHEPMSPINNKPFWARTH